MTTTLKSTQMKRSGRFTLLFRAYMCTRLIQRAHVWYRALWPCCKQPEDLIPKPFFQGTYIQKASGHLVVAGRFDSRISRCWQHCSSGPSPCDVDSQVKAAVGTEAHHDHLISFPGRFPVAAGVQCRRLSCACKEDQRPLVATTATLYTRPWGTLGKRSSSIVHPFPLDWTR